MQPDPFIFQKMSTFSLIFLKFEAHVFIKMFLMKKTCNQKKF